MAGSTMDGSLRTLALAALLASSTMLATTVEIGAQQSRGGVSARASLEITFSSGDQARIREYYATHSRVGAEALPPGIRKRLERGRPLPPGIAKNFPPQDLISRVAVPEAYQLVEVGLDVLLVEIATGIVHDVLMGVIR